MYRIECGKIYDKYGNLIGTIDENGNMYDLNGNYMGRIDENGNVYDADGNLIGKLKPALSDAECANAKYNGEVYDNNGELLYRIECGKIYDKDGKLIGYIDENGNMYDLNGNLMGRIDENGNVYDADGNLIGKLKPALSDAECANAKYNGEVRDLNGELLYTIKCGKIYDKDGNLIGYIDENGNMYDLNGNLIGRIDKNGNVYDANGNLIGKFKPSNRAGYVSGVKDLLAGAPLGMIDMAGRKIAIGDKSFTVLPDNSIVDANGAIVGSLRNGVPYSLSGNLLANELTQAPAAGEYPQVKNVFDPAQAAAMRDLLAQRRAQMKQGVGQNMAKITPDGRVLARAKEKKAKDFGSKTVSSWPVDMSRMILKDKAIPAVLVRSIDSRYKSVPASAIVERNVFAEDGRNIIIPAGSKLIGKLSGSPGENHVSKMDISWERLIRPDGSQFKLSAVSGDAQGRGGVAAYLDEQWLARYGKPILQSTVTSAISYLVASDETVTENQNYGTSSQSDRAKAAQDARENFIDDMEMIFQQMIEDSSVTPPVVFVPSGTRMTVFAMEDLWLRSAEDDEEEYKEEFGADPTQAQQPRVGGMQPRPMTGAPTGMGAPTAPAEEEEYYDPGYTEEDEEIYSPSEEEDVEDEEVKEPSLEEKYRVRQGLSAEQGKKSTSKPLNSRAGRPTSSGSLY